MIVGFEEWTLVAGTPEVTQLLTSAGLQQIIQKALDAYQMAMTHSQTLTHVKVVYQAALPLLIELLKEKL